MLILSGVRLTCRDRHHAFLHHVNHERRDYRASHGNHRDLLHESHRGVRCKIVLYLGKSHYPQHLFRLPNCADHMRLR